MKYLNNEHEELSKSQQSALMGRITRFNFDTRMTVLSGCLISGILTSALAWQGSASEKVYFCIESGVRSHQTCEDENNRPFRMTRYHWDKWRESGKPKQIILLKSELPSNPFKPFFAGVAFMSFGLAGWMFRQLQYDENRKVKFDLIANQRDEQLATLETQFDLLEKTTELELSACDNSVIIQQAELLGELEVKITQQEIAETLFEAQTAGMSTEQKQEYVDFIKKQSTPYLTGTQTLDGVTNPKDKIDGENVPVIGNWFDAATDYHCVLIWGGQGGGKTTAASNIIKARKDAGHRILVFDPHAEKGQWQGLEVVGDGMDYEEIDQTMKWYFEECKKRYQLLRSEGSEAVKKLGKVTIVAEEITNYADRCKHSGEFVKACLSDNRKIFLNVIFISHGRTLETLGNAKGMAKTRDDSFFELHCISPTKESDRRWEVKYPGGSFDPVDVPAWKNIFDFGEPVEPHSEPLNQRNSNTSSDNAPRFTRFNLTKEQVLELINSLNSELNQTEIIEKLWGCKKGGSAAWKIAYEEFKLLQNNQ